jgi:hypothetical protein
MREINNGISGSGFCEGLGRVDTLDSQIGNALIQGSFMRSCSDLWLMDDQEWSCLDLLVIDSGVSR